jgi:hypothetical protein
VSKRAAKDNRQSRKGQLLSDKRNRSKQNVPEKKKDSAFAEPSNLFAHLNGSDGSLSRPSGSLENAAGLAVAPCQITDFLLWGVRYGRGAGVGLDRGLGVDLGAVVAVGVGVVLAVAVGVAVGGDVAVGVAVAVGVGEPEGAQYLPPVCR